MFAFSRATTGYDYSEDATYPEQHGSRQGRRRPAWAPITSATCTPTPPPRKPPTSGTTPAARSRPTARASIRWSTSKCSPAIDGASSYTAWFNAWSTDVKAKTTHFMHPVIYASICAGMCDLTTACTLSHGWPTTTAKTSAPATRGTPARAATTLIQAPGQLDLLAGFGHPPHHRHLRQCGPRRLSIERGRPRSLPGRRQLATPKRSCLGSLSAI